MTTEQINSLRIGDWLMPSGGPVSSSIRILEILDQGYKVKRMNLNYNGEEFFLNKQSMITSHWIPVSGDMQLAFS